MKNATKNKPQRDTERVREQTCHRLSSFHNRTNPDGPAVAKEVLKGEGLHIRQTERARKLSSRGATQDDGEEIHESEKKRAQEDAMTRESGTKLGFTTYQFWKCRLYCRQRDGA